MFRIYSNTAFKINKSLINEAASCRYLSQKLDDPKATDTRIKINEEELDSNLKLSQNQRERQIKNKPFIKNLFCGNYIYDYLKFPEYDTNSALDQINHENVEPLKKYLKDSQYDQIIDKNGNFDQQALETFKKLGLFSKAMPKEFDGEDLDATGLARVLEESGKYPSLGMSLIYNNEVASKAILLYGSNEQREKHLKRLASGDLKAGFCFSEVQNGVDVLNFNTVAKYNQEDVSFILSQKAYTLNGTKSWVSLISNDPEGSTLSTTDAVFIVLAKTLNETGEKDTSLSAFLIDSSIPGVTFTKQLTNFNGLNLYEINFENVKLTATDLLGIEGSGHDISTKLCESSRYLVGALSVGLLKDLYKTTVDFVINSRRFNKSLSEFEFVKDRIADIETKLYTMESMVYMTAGIIDSYEKPDVGCETALTKIYCTETVRECVTSCLDLMAMGSYSKLSELQTAYISDLNYLSCIFSTNDFLRLYVATNGTVMAGMEFSDSLVKLRNPLTNPGYTLKKMYSNWQLSRSVNKKAPEYLYLWEHVHPSLSEPVAILEQCAVKFIMTIKYSLLSHGRDAVEVQFSMKHLANIAMHLYALNSVIARASRAYSIGLKNAQHEIGLVYLQANVSKTAINEAFDEIVRARSGQGLENIKTTIAENVFKAKQHAASHSTARNY